MMTAAKTNLCFAETPEQAGAARACGRQVVIVAIHPLVDYWAEKTGCPVIGIEDLFDERGHRGLGAEVISRTESLVAAIDPIMHRVVPNWPFASAVSFAAFFHYANGTLDSLVLRLEQLLGACEAFRDKALVAFRPRGEYRFCGITSLDHAPWGLITQLVPLVAAACGLEVYWIDASDEDPSQFNPVGEQSTSTIAPNIDTHGLFRRRVLQVRAWLRDMARRLYGPGTTRRESPHPAPLRGPLLISSLFADLGEGVVESWARRGGRVMDMNQAFPLDGTEDVGRRAAAACEVLWQELGQDSGVRDVLVWRGVDLWPLFAPWLKQVILEALPPLYRRAQSVWNRLITERAFGGAVFVAGGWVTDHYVVARIAQRVGLPTVSYHYGGFLGFSQLPKHERFDLAECDYFLCGGVGADRVFRQPAAQTRWNAAVRRARPVPTGVPWVAGLLAARPATCPNMPSRGGQIMIVLNALVGDCRDLGFVFPPETEYWRFMRKVVDRLAARDNVEIVIKPPLRNRYPQMPNPIIDWIRDRSLARVTVVGDIPLKDCLDLADAYIVESPSTPLLHVAATDKPLLVYINQRDYLLDADAASALRDRAAVFAQTEAEFLAGLDEFLDASDWSCGTVDDRFLRDYVVGEFGEEPAERIAEFLSNVIAGRPEEHYSVDGPKVRSVV